MADGVDVDGELRERLASVAWAAVRRRLSEFEDGSDRSRRLMDIAAVQMVDAVLDALGLEQVGWRCEHYERHSDPLRPAPVCRYCFAVYRLASPSLTPSPEADVRSEQSEANRTDAKEEG